MSAAPKGADHFARGEIGTDRLSLAGSGTVHIPFEELAGATLLDGSSCVIAYCPKRNDGSRSMKYACVTAPIEASFMARLRPALPVQNHFLVLINPSSGTGNAHGTWTNIAQPVFDAAKCTYDVRVTTRRFEATAIVENHDLVGVKAIVILSGDGLVFEALQGLRARGKIIPIAHIHGGSGNALVSSLLYDAGEKPSCACSAALMCVRGSAQPLDLFDVNLANQSVHAFLGITWGIISDIDLESETLRCLGALRFDLWGVWRLLSLRTYMGELYYLPPETTGVSLPPLAEPLPEKFQKADVTEFVGVLIVNLPMLSSKFLACPTARQADGELCIIIMKHCGRWQAAQILLSLNDASYLNHPQVQVIRCTAFRLLPEPRRHATKLAVDGEPKDYGPVQGSILPSAAQVITLSSKMDSRAARTVN